MFGRRVQNSGISAGNAVMAQRITMLAEHANAEDLAFEQWLQNEVIPAIESCMRQISGQAGRRDKGAFSLDWGDYPTFVNPAQDYVAVSTSVHRLAPALVELYGINHYHVEVPGNYLETARFWVNIRPRP